MDMNCNGHRFQWISTSVESGVSINAAPTKLATLATLAALAALITLGPH